ncbi:uncharacterized protein LOC144869522 [Branchiostoma floridae x Branchiostoma japonicum]
MKKTVALLCVTLVVAVWGCQPPDCDRKDCGTCGNACCSLSFHLDGVTSQAAYNKIMMSLKNGGADGRYSYSGGDDLRPYNISASFILQGVHMTLVHHYNDTLNFVLVDDMKPSIHPLGTTLHAFSISQIAGAYCDDGQNYKNLVGFVKGLNMKYTETTVAGCPKPM